MLAEERVENRGRGGAKKHSGARRKRGRKGKQKTEDRRQRRGKKDEGD